MNFDKNSEAMITFNPFETVNIYLKPTMSSVYVHIGQCGNQVGQAFWNKVEQRSSPRQQTAQKHRPQVATANKHKMPGKLIQSNAPVYLPFSLLDGTLPCVLVDSEPKVVQRCCSKKGVLASRVPEEFRITEKRGRGNNWACGYHDRINSVAGSRSGGSSLVECVRERVRKLVEKCDHFTGTVLFHSLAGGTGSGLGSAIIEKLREDYPLAFILSAAVAPFSLGETPLQHYNALLCLHWLHAYCDSVLLFQNDLVLEQAGRTAVESSGHDAAAAAGWRSRAKGSEATISVDDMNTHLCSSLCNSFLPVWSAGQRTVSRSCMEPWELVRSLCPVPALKFVTSVHTQTAKPGNSWDQTIATLTRSLRRREASLGRATSTALLLVSRASPVKMDTLVANVNTLERKLRQSYGTVEWNPFPVEFWFSYEPHLSEKYATVLCNSSIVCDYIETVIQKAHAMYREKAYVHWYEKYGCEQDTFREAFEGLQTVLENYSSAVH